MDDEDVLTPRGMLTHVGDWVLGDTLGRGAYAHVRRATHTSGRLSACKILPAVHRDPTQPTTWDELVDAKEAYKEVVFLKALTGIRFRGVVELEGVLERNGWLYIFTTLLPLCAAKIHAPWERRPLVDFFRQLCLSVDALHQLGISHEDLKRSNILVSSNFRPAIIDLGFGHFNPYGDFVASNGGTLDYTSPEKAAGEMYDPAANDVWSLGIMLINFLGLTHPYTLGDKELSSDELKDRLIEGEPNYKSLYTKKILSAKGPGVLIMNMLERDPDRRLTLSEVLDHPFLAPIRADPPLFRLPPLTLPKGFKKPFPPSVILDLCFLAHLAGDFYFCMSTKVIEDALESGEPCWEKRWAGMLNGWVRMEDMDWEDVKVKAVAEVSKRVGNSARTRFSPAARRPVLKEIHLSPNVASAHRKLMNIDKVLLPAVQKRRPLKKDKENIPITTPPKGTENNHEQSESEGTIYVQDIPRKYAMRDPETPARLVKTTTTVIASPKTTGALGGKRYTYEKARKSLVKPQPTPSFDKSHEWSQSPMPEPHPGILIDHHLETAGIQSADAVVSPSDPLGLQTTGKKLFSPGKNATTLGAPRRSARLADKLEKVGRGLR